MMRFLLVLTMSVFAAVATAAPTTAFKVTKTGTGRAMILIPGLTSSGEVWSATVDRFKTRYECHVLTLAGFAGQPPLPRGADAPAFLDTVRRELVRYIEAERLDRPILVGHSLGGFVAFWIASTNPDLVGPIVAVDGVPFMPALMNPSVDAAGMKAQAQQLRELYASLTQEQLASQSMLALPSMMKSPADVERAKGWSATSDPTTVGAVMYEMMTTDLRDAVAAIRPPVLLIAAGAFAKDADMRARVRATYEQQVAKVPNHRVVLAEEARHFVMWDTPDFLWTTMDGFLRDAQGR
jgi:pimeloyl-ACP methyl ester carboxylesterase